MPRPRTVAYGDGITVLVTGATGFVGAALIPALQRAGYEVRAFARAPERVSAQVPVIEGDAVTGRGLDEALEGVDVAYYLIHGMEAGEGRDLVERERLAAERFAGTAGRRGVRRIVYLGGPAPATGSASEHLRARLLVEETLLGAFDEALALRASIVVGARSRSFRLLVRLVERLRIVPLPAWRDRRVGPGDERDVLAMLLACATTPHAQDRLSLDVAGPDVLTYRELLARIAELMLIGRRALSIDLGDDVTSRLAATIAGEDHALVDALMASLGADLPTSGAHAASLLGVRLHGLDGAIEHALREWERVEPLAAR